MTEYDYDFSKVYDSSTTIDTVRTDIHNSPEAQYWIDYGCGELFYNLITDSYYSLTTTQIQKLITSVSSLKTKIATNFSTIGTDWKVTRFVIGFGIYGSSYKFYINIEAILDSLIDTVYTKVYNATSLQTYYGYPSTLYYGGRNNRPTSSSDMYKVFSINVGSTFDGIISNIDSSTGTLSGYSYINSYELLAGAGKAELFTMDGIHGKASYMGQFNLKSKYNPEGSESASSGKYPSTALGGLGTFDDSTALSDISSVPTIDISSLGFFSLWRPTTSQLVSLADYVWNDPTNVSEWPQIFQSGILKPLDYIISLNLLPLPASSIPSTSQTFSMGGIVFDGRLAALGKTISMERVSTQIVDIDMGTVSLKEYFGSFLDHAPYTTVNIYLPYYGFTELSTNEVQNADSIHLVYRVNLLDGTTAIKLHITRSTDSSAQNGSIPLQHTLYEYYTNIATNIPLTQGNNTENMKKIATICAAAATVVAAPIAGAGAAAIAGAAEGAGALGGVSGALTGAMAGASASEGAAMAGKVASGAVKAGGAMANKVINSMPSGGGVQRGNQGSFSQGLLSERRPYLIVHRPIQVLPDQFKELNGFASTITKTLGECTGLVKVDAIKLVNINATEEERQEIISLLQGGIYL